MARQDTAVGVILVVDDEQTVKTVITRALQRLGYTVITAANGLEAIDMVRASPDIEAVILDLAMPVMTGDQAAPQLRALRPGLRILLSSGYAEFDARERFAQTGVDAFLQKPYTVRALTDNLRMLLTGLSSQ